MCLTYLCIVTDRLSKTLNYAYNIVSSKNINLKLMMVYDSYLMKK